MDSKKAAFVQQVKVILLHDVARSHNKSSIEKLAGSFGILDKNEIKELTELAIVNIARYMAHQTDLSIHERYQNIVGLYNRQVNLSHRTSQSILLQQYSTPAPIGYLMGVFCNLDSLIQNGGYAFEPSAGNGLLTIAAAPQRVYVNEIDGLRRSNLQTQGFANVWSRDATKSFYDVANTFAAVLTNPPFGTLQTPVCFEDYKINSLEHLMALQALETMTYNGKAAIIIGGHTSWDTLGRVQAGKNRIFFNFLYSRYYVKDVINISGKKLYSRQGTSFDVRLILISGKKSKPEGVAPLYNPMLDFTVNGFDQLFTRVSEAMDNPLMRDSGTLQNDITMKRQSLEEEAIDLLAMLDGASLGAPYLPASEACVVLDTQVPDSMAFETQSAVDRIRQAVGGDMDNFVRHRLGYATKVDLCRALAAEQIDAVAMAIYNIEARNQGVIIGDQTGIGKGRVAAAIIRYGVQQGLKPVFLTEKANLFSDIYRDLVAIGSGHLQPFIVNGRESKTDIKDVDGNIVYQALPGPAQQLVFESRILPPTSNFIVATYSQFNSVDRKPLKPEFLRSIATDNIFVLDEAHNSSGSSNTGSFLQGIIAVTRGVAFLSATFAKRPDNMPIYAMKTAISDCTMSSEELVDAISRGGVALQEVLSAQLVAEGQMLRRERSFEGVEVNYISLDDRSEEHRAIADNITEILREIIDFQNTYVNKVVKALDKIAAAEGKEVGVREGTSQAGVDNQPYFSKIFQVINQMLFSLKAQSVADRTIMRLREGKKPVIAFASTMGSFIETLEDSTGMPVSDGSVINADFSEVLKRGLDGVLRYTEKDAAGKSIHKRFELSELPHGATEDYNGIYQRIEEVSTGITISPIDVIVQTLEKAGYTVAEVTGRKYHLQLNMETGMGLVLSRRKINTNDAFRRFNNNEVDVLMINQSGSTGASAHAVATAKIATSEVRQRVMIVLQAELDISTEVQKRGRINRTGQILKPIYDYVTSAIPAEKRLMMMLQKKLKSLDANTTSNQKQSTKILDVPDFLNKYGDKIVEEYLLENPDVNLLLDDPLHLLRASSDSDGDAGGDGSMENAAHKVSGRVAVLSTQMQTDFYNEVADRYNEYVSYLQQIGDYDLEVETMNLEAETVSSRVVKSGNGSASAFGTDSVLEVVKANVLRKPFNRAELDNLLTESMKAGDPQSQANDLIESFLKDWKERLDSELADNEEHYQSLFTTARDTKKKTQIEQITEIEEAKVASINRIEIKANGRKNALLTIFRFFYPGRAVTYSIASYGMGTELVPAVFLGYGIDLKKKNPFVPSQVKLRFAIANSSKYLVIPASLTQQILAIQGASGTRSQPERETLLDDWETQTKNANVNRNTRHIITGNLLQAFSDFKGKLVSYTTSDGQTKKGILMPEHWDAGKEVADRVTVPIINTLPLIKSIVHGGHMITNNGLSFFKQNRQYRIIVGGSRAKGGDIYLDKELLPLVTGNNFQKSADKMVAMVDEDKITDVVQVLQKNHSLSMTISNVQFQHLEKQSSGIYSIRPILLPPPVDRDAEIQAAENQQRRDLPDEKKSGATVISLLELEAEALELELQLLAA